MTEDGAVSGVEYRHFDLVWEGRRSVWEVLSWGHNRMIGERGSSAVAGKPPSLNVVEEGG